MKPDRLLKSADSGVGEARDFQMPEDFEFKTRRQFFSLIEKRDRWRLIQDQELPKKRFEQLLGPQWALDNWALDKNAVLEFCPNGSFEQRREDEIEWHQLAARRIYHWVQTCDFLSAMNLLELHHLLVTGEAVGASRFREHEIESICEGHEPMEAVLVPEVVENALEWFKAESFQQMHEIERTALVLAKLVDIHPFEKANGRTIRLISNFYLLKAGYPPAVISAAKASEYAGAIQGAIHFHTQPIIDLLNEAAHQALSYCLNEPAPPLALRVLP